MPIYMEIEGIRGDVLAKGYEGFFSVVSTSWNTEHQPGDLPRTGPITVELQGVLGMPKIFLQSMTGKPVRARISVTRITGESEEEYARYDLENVLIASFNTSHSADDLVPILTISLYFARIYYTIWFQNQKGGLSSQSESFDFSLVVK